MGTKKMQFFLRSKFNVLVGCTTILLCVNIGMINCEDIFHNHKQIKNNTLDIGFYVVEEATSNKQFKNITETMEMKRFFYGSSKQLNNLNISVHADEELWEPINANSKSNGCQVIIDDVLDNGKFMGLVLLKNNMTVIHNKELFSLQKETSVDSISRTNFDFRVCDKKEFCKNSTSQRTGCFRKCCQEGEIFMVDNCKNSSDVFDIHDFGDIPDTTPIYYNKPDCNLMRFIHFSLQRYENGSLLAIKRDAFFNFTPQLDEYCFDLYLESLDTTPTPALFYCKAKENTRARIHNIMIYISCVCLLGTIAIYCYVYKLRKLIHLVVVSLCAAQFVAFALVSISQHFPNIEEGCEVLAILIITSILATVSWLSVMCFDVWRTIGSMEAGLENKSGIWKKYFYYSLFGWLYPISIGILAFLENKYFTLPEYLHLYIGAPYKGRRYCVIKIGLEKGNYGHLLFYTIPGAIPIIANIVFFFLTIRYIIRASNLLGRATGKKILRANKEKVFMVSKLFLLMGVTWIFETLSSAVSFRKNAVLDKIEILFDSINLLQGVFIFMIFVLRWRTIKAHVANTCSATVVTTTSDITVT